MWAITTREFGQKLPGFILIICVAWLQSAVPVPAVGMGRCFTCGDAPMAGDYVAPVRRHRAVPYPLRELGAKLLWSLLLGLMMLTNRRREFWRMPRWLVPRCVSKLHKHFGKYCRCNFFNTLSKKLFAPSFQPRIVSFGGLAQVDVAWGGARRTPEANLATALVRTPVLSVLFPTTRRTPKQYE